MNKIKKIQVTLSDADFELLKAYQDDHFPGASMAGVTRLLILKSLRMAENKEN